MGSLAAVPGQPGWSLATIYLNVGAHAGAGKELQQNASIVTGLHARADAIGVMPAYTFATPVLGGQLTIGALGVPGNIGLGINATLTGPRGNQISGGVSDNRTTLAHIYYLGTLKWNQGVNNYMWYVLGNIPSGTYDSSRLANLSTGYVAVDSGFGYTYLNPHTGHEFSAVAGLTYSGTNSACSIRTASISMSTGRCRNSSARAFTSASPAMSISRSPATAAPWPSSATSRGTPPGSVRRSDFSSRPAKATPAT